MASQWLLLGVIASFLHANAMPITFSSTLIHRLSPQMKAFLLSTRSSSNNSNVSTYWPHRNSLRYYEILVNSDFLRHNMKLPSPHPLLFPSRGTKTMSLGNDFGWLHYTWIDVGTPSTSFLVALDAGSDLFWVPCDCIQCAPLSASYYANLDRDLNEYSPSRSTSSKNLSCSHQLCDIGSNCKSSTQQCSYTVNYVSENTSSSGLLVEDILHLASSGYGESNSTVQAPIIIGCGMKQSGGYLDGVAPDGLMGLGTGEISVPSLLAKSELIHNSFSMCFDDDDSGRIFFGDQGPASQQSTPFLQLDGSYSTYVVGVEACCIKDSCLKMSSFKAQVDSGTSFTFLPGHVYDAITEEFDQQVNASRSTFEGSPWDYCYASSSPELPKVPSLTFTFQENSSFVVHNPVFVFYDSQGVIGFCLAIQPTDGDMGTIGQNFMTGYRLVFDRDNMKLCWSQSSCEDLAGDSMPFSPNKTPPKPLPTNEQQRTNGHAVAPAIAGRAPHKPSTASSRMMSCQQQHWHICLFLLLQLVVASSRL